MMPIKQLTVSETIKWYSFKLFDTCKSILLCDPTINGPISELLSSFNLEIFVMYLQISIQQWCRNYLNPVKVNFDMELLRRGGP